jgi:hypothetical protein
MPNYSSISQGEGEERKTKEKTKEKIKEKTKPG